VEWAQFNQPATKWPGRWSPQGIMSH